MTEAAYTSVAVDNFDFLSDADVTNHWKCRKNRRKCCFSVDDEEWYMVDFEAVG